MKIIGIIPSRLQSTRLPNKALVDIEGFPMIGHVFKRSQMASSLSEVIVATDNQDIYRVVTDFGGQAVMTSASHQTGTDRVAEVARGLDADIIVNIQGDEPLLNPAHIDQAVGALMANPEIQVSVLVTPYAKRNSPSDIKAVLDKDNNILYCSREDLPSASRVPVASMWKMCFMVPFRREFLLQYAAWPQTALEKIEYNEYLRILENGYKIKAVPVEKAHISVDTPDDLTIVRDLMKTDGLKRAYL